MYLYEGTHIVFEWNQSVCELRTTLNNRRNVQRESWHVESCVKLQMLDDKGHTQSRFFVGFQQLYTRQVLAY